MVNPSTVNTSDVVPTLPRAPDPILNNNTDNEQQGRFPHHASIFRSANNNSIVITNNSSVSNSHSSSTSNLNIATVSNSSNPYKSYNKKSVSFSNQVAQNTSALTSPDILNRITEAEYDLLRTKLFQEFKDSQRSIANQSINEENFFDYSILSQ